MSQPITIDFPAHARAVLLTRDDDGVARTLDVPHGSSVLNIERDLLKHLSDQPFSDAWLTDLRDYLGRRLSARADARRAGYLIQPTEDGADFVRVAPAVKVVAPQDAEDADRWRTFLSLLRDHRPTLGLPAGVPEDVAAFVTTIDSLRSKTAARHTEAGDE